MNEKQIQDRFNKTFQDALSKARICSVSGCNENAINSHILQKNGALNGIAQEGHIRLSQTDFHKDNLFYFKKEGINKSYTFKGFCKEHDSSIFAPIEDDLIDFENYNNQLLFAYRNILNEKVRKEVLLDWYEYKRQDNILKKVIDIDLLEQIEEQEKLGISDLDYYVKIFENDLNNNEESFVFQFRYTSSKEICLASQFTYETTRVREEEIQKNGKDFELLTEISVSFFPLDGENVLLMGYLKESETKCGTYVKAFFDVPENELMKKLSNLLMCRCEMWACSEDFYNEKIKQREEKINLIFLESTSSIDEDRDINFNIFD